MDRVQERANRWFSFPVMLAAVFANALVGAVFFLTSRPPDLSSRRSVDAYAAERLWAYPLEMANLLRDETAVTTLVDQAFQRCPPDSKTQLGCMKSIIEETQAKLSAVDQDLAAIDRRRPTSRNVPRILAAGHVWVGKMQDGLVLLRGGSTLSDNKLLLAAQSKFNDGKEFMFDSSVPLGFGRGN
jgi:hypothetical protein